MNGMTVRKKNWIYYDPDGGGEVINEACAFVHRCVDWEEYKVGYEIADMLFEAADYDSRRIWRGIFFNW